MTEIHADASSSGGADGSGTVIDQRYELVRPLGQGSMGTVYLARQTRLQKPVAIKQLRSDLAHNPTSVARFLDEARIASRIRHPNVVDISDFGEHEGSPYFVMEYLEGLSLKELVDTSGPLPWDRAIGVIKQVAVALEAAHLEGVIHCDVKPSNCFLLTPSDPDREAYFVKVLDFAIAKVTNAGAVPSTDEHDAALGSPHYMAPELATLGKADVRCDIYALGVLAYQTMTGAVPFDGPTTFAILTRHLNDVPKPLREYDPQIPEAVEAWVARAMAKDPEDRFVTMSEARMALRDLDPYASSASSTLLSLGTASASTLVRRSSNALPDYSAASHTALPALGSSSCQSTTVGRPGGSRRRSPRSIVLGTALLTASLSLTFGLYVALHAPRDERQEAAVAREMTSAQMLEDSTDAVAEVRPVATTSLVVLPAPPLAPMDPVWAPEPPHAVPPRRARRAVEKPIEESFSAFASGADDPLPPTADVPHPVARKLATPPPSDASNDEDECIVPFEVDDRGHKRFKRECL